MSALHELVNRLQKENRELHDKLSRESFWRDTLAEVIDVSHGLRSLLAAQPPIYLCDAVKHEKNAG